MNLNIYDNPTLSSISGFNGRLVVSGPSGTGSGIGIYRNAALETIAGFDTLDTKALNISTNTRLREISGFNNTRVEVSLYITGNPAGLRGVALFPGRNGLERQARAHWDSLERSL
ncbi:hypothetical protein [Hymenobacter koreensis]|uniref:Uncharacterized protein n=1 Tax=Hymenobacter koreensis TaxID=1084523 RepID=A0ABP8JNY6_9BACT